MGGIKVLIVYKQAFPVALMGYRLAKNFPPEEKSSITDPCRRNSRSIRAQLAEAFRKRRYPLHVVSKLTDRDGKTPKPGPGLTSQWPVRMWTKRRPTRSEHSAKKSVICRMP